METNGRAEALHLLGLARRAGAAAAGVDVVRRTVRQGEARLVLLAGDASSVQLKKIERTIGSSPIPRFRLGDRASLGAAVGRASASAVVVTGASFATELLRRLVEGENRDELEG